MKRVDEYDAAGRHVRVFWVDDDVDVATGEAFSPVDASVAQVLAYLRNANQGERERIGALEKENGQRKTIIKEIYGDLALAGDDE